MSDDIYKNRDMLLGEIHKATKDMAEWCKEHDKKDDKRFMWTCIAIIVVAASAGVIPQLTAFAMEHFK